MKNFFIIISLIFLISSCSIFKQNTSKMKISGTTFIDSVNKDFKSLSFKFSADYSSNEQKLSFFGSTKIIKDSVMYISISLGFGITIAEIFATPDTFIIYMPVQKDYIAGNKDVILKNYSIAFDFYSLQSIFTADLFSYPYFTDLNSYSLDKDSLYIFKNLIYNQNNSKIVNIAHLFYITDNFNIKYCEIYDNLLHKDLYINYSNFKTFDNYDLPEHTELKVVSIDTLSLFIISKKVIFNEQINIKFNLPDNAKPINY